MPVFAEALLSVSLLAHAGHGHPEQSPDGLWHYITTPSHVAPLLAGMLVIAASGWTIRAVRGRRGH